MMTLTPQRGRVYKIQPRSRSSGNRAFELKSKEKQYDHESHMSRKQMQAD